MKPVILWRPFPSNGFQAGKKKQWQSQNISFKIAPECSKLSANFIANETPLDIQQKNNRHLKTRFSLLYHSLSFNFISRLSLVFLVWNNCINTTKFLWKLCDKKRYASKQMHTIRALIKMMVTKRIELQVLRWNVVCCGVSLLRGQEKGRQWE